MTRDALYDRYKDDWQFAEAVEEVTWTPKGQGPISGIKATRGDLSKSMRFLGQEFMALGCDTVLNLWDATILGDLRPAADKATLTDARGVSYTIEYAKCVAFDTQWLLGLKAKAR